MQMDSSTILFGALCTLLLSISLTNAAPNLFREYIGAEGNGVKFSDVPINPDVQFDFILAFAIDYTNDTLPTDGNFHAFWDTDNLNPSAISSLKSTHRNVRVAVSVGGDTVNGDYAYFQPSSVSSWVSNAVASLTEMTEYYHLDGIDIDYEHYHAEPDVFVECIGQLITTLKSNQVISFASIAPYEDSPIQSHYEALWGKYHDVIDYVNFQFYAYDKGTSVKQFLQYFDQQKRNYNGGQLLASFISDGSLGLAPGDGFFEACGELREKGELGGIFVWSADDSKAFGYVYEKQAQQLLASGSELG